MLDDYALKLDALWLRVLLLFLLDGCISQLLEYGSTRSLILKVFPCDTKRVKSLYVGHRNIGVDVSWICVMIHVDRIEQTFTW